MRSPQRRDLLGLATGATTTLLAGCLSDSVDTEAPGDQTDSDATNATGTTETTTGPTPGFVGVDVASWSPVPKTDSGNQYWTFYVNAATVRAADVSEQATRRTKRLFAAVPSNVLAFDETDESLSLNGEGVVCTYEVATDELRSRLASAAEAGNPEREAAPTGTAAEGPDTRTASDGTAAAADDQTEQTTGAESTETTPVPDGYESFSTPQGYYWLADDHLLFGGAPEILRRMHRTAEDEVDSYATVSGFRAVLDAVGDVDLFAGRVGAQQAVESSAFGYGWTLDGEATLTAAFAFPDADAVDTAAVDALATKPGFAAYEYAETTTDGRVATLSGTLELSEFDLLGRDDNGTSTSARVPRVSFSFEFNEGKDGEWDGGEDERVVVQHDGGDTVELAEITLRYDGTAVAERATVDATYRTGDTWTAGGDVVLRNATTEAAFESGASVTVVWSSPTDDRAQVLAKADLP